MSRRLKIVANEIPNKNEVIDLETGQAIDRVLSADFHIDREKTTATLTVYNPVFEFEGLVDIIENKAPGPMPKFTGDQALRLMLAVLDQGFDPIELLHDARRIMQTAYQTNDFTGYENELGFNRA